MSDRDDQGPAEKKRRVTKACDVCRRKRIKCAVVPGAPDGSPCKICIDSGIASDCTFSRPSKKRGPAAGRAKELEQRTEHFESLLGYLLITVPGLSNVCEAYLATAHPSSDAHRAIYLQSSLPGLFNAIADASHETPVMDAAPTFATSAQLPHSELGDLPFWTEAASPVASTSTSTSHMPYMLPSPGPSVQLAASTGLHTLADAAFQDTQHRWPSPEFVPPSGRSPARQPDLPKESTRNTLLDLYFNFIVQPTFPMLDKNRFFRWTTKAPESNEVPSYLYNAVFAVVTSFIPPSQSDGEHAPEDYADAARAELYLPATKPTIEAIQAFVLLSLFDWGQGALDRAWLLSSVALALSLTLNLHHGRLSQKFYMSSDPNCVRVNTFHAVATLHTLLSLRLVRPTLIRVEDYSAPPAPHDGAENYELWRSDMSSADLRAAYGLPSAAPSSSTASNRPQAVRSSAQATFSQLVLLCSLGGHVLRFHTSQVKDSDEVREKKRSELVQVLQMWEADLPPDLKIGVGAAGTEKLPERARHVVELHLLLLTLYQKLVPSPKFEGSAYDPSPHAASLTGHIFARYLETFTCLRSLPVVELSLAVFCDRAIATSSRKMLEAGLRVYDELGVIWKIGRDRARELRKRAGPPPPAAAASLAGSVLAASPGSLVGPSPAASTSTVIMHSPPVPLPPATMTEEPRVSTPLRTMLEYGPLSAPTPVFSGAAASSSGPTKRTTSESQSRNEKATFPKQSDPAGSSATTIGGAEYPSLTASEWNQRELLVSLGLVADPTVVESLSGPSSSAFLNSSSAAAPSTSTSTAAADRQGTAAAAAQGGWSFAQMMMGGGSGSGIESSNASGTGELMEDDDQDVLMRWLDRGHLA